MSVYFYKMYEKGGFVVFLYLERGKVGQQICYHITLKIKDKWPYQL
jgi:hypothetical protein